MLSYELWLWVPDDVVTTVIMSMSMTCDKIMTDDDVVIEVVIEVVRDIQDYYE